jgi:hypothetical protein
VRCILQIQQFLAERDEVGGQLLEHNEE